MGKGINPGMRMMLMNRMTQPENNRSEYGGGNRRMIGYDRNGERGYQNNSSYNGSYNGGYEGYGAERTESRRRRDSRGRYAVMDDDYETESYSPQMRSGNSYGDIYARGEIYAPYKPMSMGGDMSQPVDEHTARMWVQKMDGGEKFKLEQAEQMRKAICPDCDMWEYFVAINAMYSDYNETAKKMGVDKLDYYAHLAKDFLKDKDAGPHKLRKYMEYIAK